MKPIKSAVLALTFGLLAACDDASLVPVDELSSADMQDETSSGTSGDVSGSSGSATSGSSVNGSSSSGALAQSSSSSEQLCAASWVGKSVVTINEIMPGNVNWYDDLGKDPGWVELYNSSSEPVALNGLALVENTARPRKWVAGNDTIPANGYRIIFASDRGLADPPAGVDSDSLHYRTHTNWKLEDEGGSLYLVSESCGILDSASYPALDAGISWGKTSSGWLYFAKSTPEASNANSTGSTGFVSLPAFGQNAGFYQDSVVITPPTTDDGSTVRCTFNGSEPTASTVAMSEAVVLKKSSVVRCAAFKDGLITNKIVTNTYFIDEEINNMPVVSISVDSQFFENHYLYTSAGSTNGYSPSSVDPNDETLYADVEFPVHVEYFANGSASDAKAWEIDAGISLMGGYSRLEKKKSVAITMREEYQDGWLKYPLFETRSETNSKFKSFNLRNNGNRFVSDYIADAAGGAILEGSGVDYQRSHQVIVFYDGVYWGIHDMRERYNKNYVETNYGIDASNVTVVKHLNQTITASNGTPDEYLALLAYVSQADFSGANNEAYAYVQTLMDVTNFASYMIAEIFDHNGDWPNNNVRAWKSPNTLWKFMIYDLDHGFDWMWNVAGFGQSTNMFDWVNQGGYSSGKCYKNPNAQCFLTFYVRLMQNPDFKRMFINRAAVMLKEYVNGTNLSNVIDAMVATIDADQRERDQNLFKQSERYYSNSCGNGFSNSGSCIKEWGLERDAVMRSEYREEFGLSSDVEVTIAATGNGYVTLDGFTLPSLSSYTGTFFGGNAMLLTAVPSGTGKFVAWEDGSTDNPRLVMPQSGASYIAQFN